MRELVCVADLGTSSVKAAFVGPDGSFAAFRSCDAPPPVAEGVNFDADKLFDVLCGLIRSMGSEHPDCVPGIQGLALSTQRATVLPVGDDGMAVAPAISWQDVSGQADLEEHVRRLGVDEFRAITGLPATGLCSASKILKLRRVQPDACRRVARFVMLPDYILFRLGAKGFFTDLSNASTAGLLDTRKSCWSRALLDSFGLSPARLPEIVPAGHACGALSREASRATGLRAGLPLFAGGGDLQCAAAVSGALKAGNASLSLGTCGIVTCPVDSAPSSLPQGLFCTVHVAEKLWLLEGMHNAFAGSLNWVSELLGLGSVNELFELAARAQPPKPEDPLFLPFLAGIGSPDFDSVTAGAFLGLKYPHGRAELSRACLEGVALEMQRIFDAMAAVGQIQRIAVSGGLSSNRNFLKLLATVTGYPMVQSETREASLQGAAAIAWKGAGRYATITEAASRFAGAGMSTVAPEAATPEQVKRSQRYREAVLLGRRFAGTLP